MLNNLSKAELIQHITDQLRYLSHNNLEELSQQLKKQQNTDQRTHKRTPFFLEAQRKDLEQSLTEFVKAIGAGGIFLETSASIELGSELSIIIHSVGINNAIALKGQVVRVKSDGVGIKFPEPIDLLDGLFDQPVGQFQTLRVHFSGFVKKWLKETLSQDLIYTLKSIRAFLYRINTPILKVRYWGKSHYCPICKSNTSQFLPFVEQHIPNAYCPVCRSLERHRLDWLFFKQETDLFSDKPKKMLHIAPEEIFEKKFRKINQLEYITGDISNPRAMYQVDICNMQFEDDSFDIIYCSHVLEHVTNDFQALQELLRVLKPGGWALLQVPITANKTFEDPSITDPAERKKWFGQEDHVRRYGPDFQDRLRDSGFLVKVIPAKELTIHDSDFERYGFQRNRLIFFCEKDTVN